MMPASDSEKPQDALFAEPISAPGPQVMASNRSVAVDPERTAGGIALLVPSVTGVVEVSHSVIML